MGEEELEERREKERWKKKRKGNKVDENREGDHESCRTMDEK